MRKKWANILLLCLLVVCCNAQTAGYKFYAQLDSVKKSGFYNIEISPELSAHLKTDFSDLRIVNDSGKWVPHIVHTPAIERSDMNLSMDLRLIKKESTKATTIIEVAAGNYAVDNIILVIRNTAAERFSTLSGSDDGKNWFVINDSIMIKPVFEPGSTVNSFTLNFPPNHYNFFRVVIYNNNKDPFDVKDVMQNISFSSPDDSSLKMISNPAIHIDQLDSARISYIKITQQQPFHFNNISLKIEGVKYFSRKADLYIPAPGYHSFSSPGSLLQSFTISNNSSLQFKLPVSNATVFYLRVNNEDNLPLKITAINTAVYPSYLSTYLEQGNKYTLIMENPAAIPPNYDLGNIITKFSGSTPSLSFKKIVAFEQTPIIITAKKNNSWILWTSVIAALIILLLFTRKMITEVDKRKSNDRI